MVAKHGSITAACDQLHRAQPTISGPLAVFAAPKLAARYREDFPRCLNGAPFLLLTLNLALGRSLDQWFDNRQITPAIQAEMEDSALLKTFGAAGTGLFF